MHLPTVTPFTLFVWLVFGIVTAVYAKRTGKNPYLWFILGTFLGVLGIFLLFFMPKTNRKEATPPQVKPIPKDLFWFYLDEDNQQRGPFSLEVMKKIFQEGKLTPQTYVWNQTLDKWEPFSQFIQQI